MLKLIRPYLKYSACHYSFRVVSEAVSVKKSISTIEDQWIIDAIVQKAYSRLYVTWENSIKKYLNDQREWNGLPDEFDWYIGDFASSTDRVQSYLSCFTVEITMSGIDKIREMKEISADEYFTSCKVVEKFWLELEGYETFRLEPYPGI
jgi:uncharacterized membrane protein